jgi:hypothetical protein
MKIIIIISLVLIIWAVSSWIAIKSIEEPKYKILSDEGIYEIRIYEPYILAETKVSGSYKEALNKGFSNIADYIFGNNKTNEKISMTVPVAEEYNKGDSEKISMTVPVINQGNDQERIVSFVMPSKYTLSTLPSPNTDLVTFREVTDRKVAVLKYGWYTNETRIKEKAEILLEELKKDGVETIGEYSSARYNPPFSIPLLLRNEILIEIK